MVHTLRIIRQCLLWFDMSTTMFCVTGSDSFNGYLQDVRLYLPSITNR